MYRSSIPDNVTSWKVFDDDLQILYLLTPQDTFKDLSIDEVEHDNSLFDHNFPSNLIPKSVINLEKYYDLQDKFKGNPNCKTHSSSLNFKTVNLRNEKNPQLINIGITYSLEEEMALVKLPRELKYVFAWTYDDLKTFDSSIMQLNMPLNHDIKPYQQNLRKMHPSLEPSIKKELQKLLNVTIIFPVKHTVDL